MPYWLDPCFCYILVYLAGSTQSEFIPDKYFSEVKLLCCNIKPTHWDNDTNMTALHSFSSWKDWHYTQK